MSETTSSMLTERSPGVAVSRRPLIPFLLKVVRNPLTALPDEAFHAPLVYARLNGRVRLYLCDPVLIHDALVRNADCLAKANVAQRVLRPALGDGLLTAEGAGWRWQRQSVAPAFQHARLLGFLPAMIDAAERTRERWLALPPGDSLDVGHEMILTTFAIIVETMLSGAASIDVGRVEGSISAYLRSTTWAAALGILGAPEWMPYPGSRRARTAAAYLRSAVTAMVAERRRGPADRDDLVALLLAATDPDTGRRMTDAEIADNLLTFITAGHETTAQGLAWTLHLLARHSAVEAAVLAEVEAVTGGGRLCPEHVAGLAYTRQVFSEAMRLYPPAPMITRKVVQPFTLSGGTVVAGTVLIVPTFALHRHAALWDEPARFDPARFAPDQVKARHRYSYIPFGAGPRICIGSAFATLEAVAILAVLVRSFRLTDSGGEPPEPTMQITLRPTRPIRMRPERRAAG